MEKEEKILYKYYFANRNKNLHEIQIPSNIKTSCEQQLFKNVPEYIGKKIPYNTICNINGIYKRICTEDEDGLVMVVAPPGYGKSTVAIIFSKLIDNELDISKIIFDEDELDLFLRECTKELRKESEYTLEGKIYKSKLKGSSIILDEGVFMLFSGDAMTKQGKKLQKLFSIIRALNLMIIVNATNFRKINRGIKDERLIGLIKINKRGVISFFSKKKISQIKITENNIKWSRPNYTEFIGKIDTNSKLWKEYKLKKSNFLVEVV